MSKPLTMRQDQWDDIRDLWDGGHPLQWIVAQGNVHSMFREIDALRAALAAAEAKLAEWEASGAEMPAALKAALADERRHADEIASVLRDHEGEAPTPCLRCRSVLAAHAARRAAEKSHVKQRWECPTCGLGVAADEDGCCATCGADCKAQEVKP